MMNAGFENAANIVLELHDDSSIIRFIENLLCEGAGFQLHSHPEVFVFSRCHCQHCMHVMAACWHALAGI